MSADLCEPAGQCMVGNCYEHGIGVTMNKVEASRYYKLSSDQGFDVEGICKAFRETEGMNW